MGILTVLEIIITSLQQKVATDDVFSDNYEQLFQLQKLIEKNCAGSEMSTAQSITGGTA